MGTHSQVGCHRINHSSEFFAEHGYLEVPSLVQWMATLRCGLSCEHCLAVSQEAGFTDMPIEKVRGLIDEVAAMGVREFLVTGGEPLVREDWAEVIEYLGGRGVNWTLNTAAMPGAGPARGHRAEQAGLCRREPGWAQGRARRVPGQSRGIGGGHGGDPVLQVARASGSARARP